MDNQGVLVPLSSIEAPLEATSSSFDSSATHALDLVLNWFSLAT